MDLRDAFNRTWEARGRFFDAAEELTAKQWTREFDFSWRSLRDLTRHIIEVERKCVAEDILGRKPRRPNAAQIARYYSTPARARARGQQVARLTRQVLAAYVPRRLGEARSGFDRDGRPAEFTIEEILTHAYTHELRHQGEQLAMLFLLGRKPPKLDWI